jgi:hypothetical protein
MVGYDGKIEEIRLPKHADDVEHPSLIGSAFNGGFLHCIARGHDPFTAAQLAQSVAVYKGICGNGLEALPTAEDLE